MIKTLKAKHGMFGIAPTKVKVKPIHFRIPMDKSLITNQWEILRASPEENWLRPRPVWWFLLDGSLNILVSCWRFPTEHVDSDGVEGAHVESCWRAVGGSTKKNEICSSNLIWKDILRGGWTKGVPFSSDITPSCSSQILWISNTDMHPCFWWLRMDKMTLKHVDGLRISILAAFYRCAQVLYSLSSEFR